MFRHGNEKKNHGSHGHVHGIHNANIASTREGIRAIQWSFIGLFMTALLQVIVVMHSGSVALLADTIHNIGDAITAVPLLLAFKLLQKKPTKRFTYGYGRVEDLAGVFIVFIILISAIVAGYESIDRLMHPVEIKNVWAVIGASMIGFIGNEAVAILRIRTGKKMKSAALIVDGYHARVDGLTSLAVLFGAIGALLGYPFADPIIGLLITATIMKIVYDSGKTIFARLIDGVDPDIIDEIRHAVDHIPQVKDVTEIRARWLGHNLVGELNITVDSQLSVESGHVVAVAVRDQLRNQLRHLENVVIHVDPENASGEQHHIGSRSASSSARS
ncbi:MAG: cation transporter [Spirochaetes bacterium RBG_16_49_21]|nr:MAG: cation transporter [Spirochaetes bacterium RBG_16_49_21]